MAVNMKFLRFVLVVCLPAIVSCATIHRLGELPQYAAITPEESGLVELTRIKRSEGLLGNSGSGASATGIGNTVSSSSKNSDLLGGLLGGLLSGGGGGGGGGGGLLGGVTGGLLGGGGGGAGGLLGILLMLILKLLPSVLGVLG